MASFQHTCAAYHFRNHQRYGEWWLFLHHANSCWKCFWICEGVRSDGNGGYGVGWWVSVGMVDIPSTPHINCNTWRKRFAYCGKGAPIAGYLLNAYGGENSTLQAYHPAMFYAGSLALGAAGLVAIVRLKINRGLLKKL